MSDRIGIAAVITAVVAEFGAIAIDARSTVPGIDTRAGVPTHFDRPDGGTMEKFCRLSNVS
jgi:hypothetical protein